MTQNYALKNETTSRPILLSDSKGSFAFDDKKALPNKYANQRKSLRSPLFYVGDKYKLMAQLKSLFQKILNAILSLFVVVVARF